jgi:hypothetical protein
MDALSAFYDLSIPFRDAFGRSTVRADLRILIAIIDAPGRFERRTGTLAPGGTQNTDCILFGDLPEGAALINLKSSARPVDLIAPKTERSKG